MMSIVRVEQLGFSMLPIGLIRSVLVATVGFGSLLFAPYSQGITNEAVSTPVVATNNPSVIAKAGTNEINTEDLKYYIGRLPSKDQINLSKDLSAQKNMVLALLGMKLVCSEAIANKWDQQQKVIDALAKVREQLVSETFLQSVSVPPQDFPPPTLVKSSYDQLVSANALQVPKQYHLAEIVVACPKGADELKVRNKCEAIVQELNTTDFSTVAQKQSDDKVRGSQGGDLGFLTEAQMPPKIRFEVRDLANGKVTSPIRLENGYHLVKLVEVKESYTATLDEVRETIIQTLRNQREKILGKEHITKLLQTNPVTLNESSLTEFFNAKGKQ